MGKRMLVSALALCLLLCGCGVKNSEYIEELRARGEDEVQIAKLIQYESKNKNLPDGGYVDVTGRCVGEVAEDLGITLEEYLTSNGLPYDMPYLVSETEANYTMPAGRAAAMYGMDFDSMAKMYNLPKSVDETTPWGIAIGETTVGAYVGEENVGKFKDDYGLDDLVSADTKWKEIRETVDRIKKERRKNSAVTED